MRRLIALALMVLVGWLVNVDLLWPLIAAAAGVIGLAELQAFLDRRQSSASGLN